ILEGLEAVRKKPGMYIDSVTMKGAYHLIWEIIDNSIDEALASSFDQTSNNTICSTPQTF
ncbi:MAG: hypothetical protein Q8844_02750, partial [Pigeon pea little leaf phytoplasma]|nr:hypothetical protein [Pigeon pea little leaf phytoplasma]